MEFLHPPPLLLPLGVGEGVGEWCVEFLHPAPLLLPLGVGEVVESGGWSSSTLPLSFFLWEWESGVWSSSTLPLSFSLWDWEREWRVVGGVPPPSPSPSSSGSGRVVGRVPPPSPSPSPSGREGLIMYAVRTVPLSKLPQTLHSRGLALILIDLME